MGKRALNQGNLVPDQSLMFSRSTKTGNVLSTIESQGFRKTKDCGLTLFETGVRSSGKCTSEPEGHFVPEICRKAE
jgi:hypothetical protein